MKKTLTQGVLTLGLFFALWFALMQLDWVSIFQVEKLTDKTEEKLGELILESINRSEVEVKDAFVINSVDSIVERICLANAIDQSKIKVHIVESSEVNAFALPDAHLVIFSALMSNSHNPEELAGVIAHELAHIELNHVMQKLVKEIGLSVLISITTGNGGGDMAKETLKVLSSSAFDRNFEREADMKAVDYLNEAEIDPEPFANFLYKLSHGEHELMQYLTWISTHPESKERAKAIVEYSQNSSIEYKEVLDSNTWQLLKRKLSD